MSNKEKVCLQKSWSSGPGMDLQFLVKDRYIHKVDLKLLSSPTAQIEIEATGDCGNVSDMIMAWMDQYLQHREPNILLPFQWDLLPPFTIKVLEALQKIPVGTCCSYGEIAKRLGNPKAARAVGSACRRNPFVFVVPCHRVLDGKNQLRGYSAGGIGVKKVLLDWEMGIVS